MKKILLCEDDEALISMVRFKLTKEQLGEVFMAKDGRKAKEMITNEHFDIIISDIHMPYHSGMELLTFLRQDLKKDTPFIILSAEGLEKTVMQAFDLGTNDFLTKPFSPNELAIRVRRILKL